LYVYTIVSAIIKCENTVKSYSMHYSFYYRKCENHKCTKRCSRPMYYSFIYKLCENPKGWNQLIKHTEHWHWQCSQWYWPMIIEYYNSFNSFNCRMSKNCQNRLYWQYQSQGVQFQLQKKLKKKIVKFKIYYRQCKTPVL